MTVVTTERALGRSLMSSDLFDRLTDRVVQNTSLPSDLAERIMDQTLAFLAANAYATAGKPLAPSALVDEGWHVFLMYTREYQDFCRRVVGHFIHHVPHEDDDTAERSQPGEARTRTLEAIERAGYAVDPELWPMISGNCGPCHEEGNCSASGKDGNDNKDTRK